jgi:hypothetical protein
LVAAALASAVALVGCGAASPGPPSAVASPLDAVATASGSAWAVAPMGILSHEATTFWQLFGRNGSTWVLATPPGIATNGGVVVAPGPDTAITAAVLPSGNLHFSAIQARANAVAAWSSGALPAGLVATPDALATSSAGRRLALVTTAGGTVVQSPGALSSWRTLASLSQVARATATDGCRLAALSAVGFSPSGTPLVAGACSTGGALPIAVREGGTWRLVDARATFGQDPDVLRLETDEEGAAAMMVVGRPSGHGVIAAWGSRDLSTWTATAPLALSHGVVLVSTTLDAVGRAVVVLARPGGSRIAYTATEHGSRWVVLPRLPDGTVDVVPGAAGSYQALAVSGATLVVFEATRGAWHTRQRLVVPISIGSSQ